MARTTRTPPPADPGAARLLDAVTAAGRAAVRDPSVAAALRAGTLDADALCRELATPALEELPAGQRAAAYEALLAHRPAVDPDAGTFALVRDRDPRRAAGAFWT